MFALAAGKSRTGRALANPVLTTEGKVTFIDGVLALAVLVGISLNAALGWWWADPVAGLFIVYYAVREARHIISAPQDSRQMSTTATTSTRATRRNGWACCALAAVLFGAATPTTKLLVDNIGSVSLAGLLYLGAAAAVAPFTLREQRSTATNSQRAPTAAGRRFGEGLAPVLLVLALDRTPAGTVSLFLNLELVATAVIARVFSKNTSAAAQASGSSSSCSAG